MSVQENLEALTKSIPAHCTLVAVSKTHPPEKINEAYQWGQRVFGENRAQELVQKYEVMPRDIEWHMIGHMQSNKVKTIAPFVSLIHSVDSTRLLQEINRQAARVDRVLPCLLQVHIADESSKFGFTPDEVTQLIEGDAWKDLPHVAVKGLMGMATLTEDQDQIRNEFRGLKRLFEKFKATQLPPSVSMEILSMGMSGDFRIAIEEGSTMVRVGSAIFGPR